MSLYKTKHLTHVKNKKKKSFKIEISSLSEPPLYSTVWLMDSEDRAYWERVPQKCKAYLLTGKLKCCLKSKGRGRPHVFQKYITPQVERSEECLYLK